MKIDLSDDEKLVVERLLEFWRIHRRFDANMASLAAHTGVSRDTIYRWLNRKILPRPRKVALIREWLISRGGL
jgi:hypothetical protein